MALFTLLFLKETSLSRRLLSKLKIKLVLSGMPRQEIQGMVSFFPTRGERSACRDEAIEIKA
ncbi:hypothetical protein ACFLUJ_01905 [Chloroflexota bacterium]